MKFTVAGTRSARRSAFVSRALPSRPVVPVLSGMLLEAAADGLTLSCFDYEVSARIRVDAEVAEPGSALVPGRLLAEITRSLPAGPAEFAGDAEMVSLTCGRAEFGLVCLPAEDYPALPDSPEPVGVVDGGVLAAAVGQVAAAASRDDTLPMLTAVCLDISGEVMTLAATDRYRLAAREVDFAPPSPGSGRWRWFRPGSWSRRRARSPPGCRSRWRSAVGPAAAAARRGAARMTSRARPRAWSASSRATGGSPRG